MDNYNLKIVSNPKAFLKTYFYEFTIINQYNGNVKGFRIQYSIDFNRDDEILQLANILFKRYTLNELIMLSDILFIFNRQVNSNMKMVGDSND